MSLKRVLVVGDAGVGKTQFIRKKLGECFEPMYLPTLGGIKEYRTDGVIYYDYPGQEIYSRHSLRGAVDQVIYLYDMTSRMSFKNIVQWRLLIGELYGKVDSVTIGTKSDLSGRLKVVGDVCVSNK